MERTPIEIEKKVVGLYGSFVPVSEIRAITFLSRHTIYNILKRHGIDLIWESPARINLTHFRCTECALIKEIQEFPNASSSNKFAKKKARCKTCLNRYRALWRARDVEKDRKYNRDRMNRERKGNNQLRLAQNLRCRVNATLRKMLFKWAYQKRKPKLPGLIGCSVQHLVSHVESKFKPGMSWSNHSKEGWHIDHEIPYQQFDLSTYEGSRAWCHWTNLQPLWASENKLKSNKLNFSLPC